MANANDTKKSPAPDVMRANDLVSDIEVQVLAVKTMLGMVDENVQSLLTDSDASNRVVYQLEDIGNRLNIIGETFQPLLDAIHGAAKNQAMVCVDEPSNAVDPKAPQLRALLDKTADAIYQQESLCRLMPQDMRAMQDDIGTVSALCLSIAKLNGDIFDSHQALTNLLDQGE